MAEKNAITGVRHFFWDFDGTLFDTYPIIIEDLRRCLQAYGFDCDPRETMGLMLDNIGTARDHYADRFGIDRGELKAAFQQQRSRELQAFTAKPFPGIAAVLEQILALGGKNYIFTHSKPETIETYLKKHGLDGYFHDILGDGSPGFVAKPAPDSLFFLMEKHGIEPGQAVMVGDRDRDLGSARAAGIATAHFVCSVVPEELDCNWRFENFEQMLSALKES